MTLSEYVSLTLILVKNQARLVEECGYCISWSGNLCYYNTIDEYTQCIRNQLEEHLVNFDMEFDVTIEEALEAYGL